MDKAYKIERFFKHRRNMLLLSGIFIFLVLSGGTIKHINILGSQLDFSNPEIPVKILFISIVYMLIKYVQFTFELNEKGIKNDIRSIVLPQVTELTHKYAVKNGGGSGFDVNDYTLVANINYFTFEVRQDISRHVTSQNEKIVAKGVSDTYIMGFKQLWPLYLKAFIHILIKTTWFAEYAMPFLLATFSIVLYLFTDINNLIALNSNN